MDGKIQDISRSLFLTAGTVERQNRLFDKVMVLASLQLR